MRIRTSRLRLLAQVLLKVCGSGIFPAAARLLLDKLISLGKPSSLSIQQSAELFELLTGGSEF